MTDQPPRQPLPPPPTAPSLTPEEMQRRQQAQAVTQALRGGAPLVYGNMIAIAQTSSDMSLIVMANGNPAMTVSMSYITAKSLLSDLARAISVFESAYGQPVKTINEINPEIEKKMREAKSHVVR
jgi:hypothetical protein